MPTDVKLSSDERVALDGLLPLLDRIARDHLMPVDSVVTSRFFDPEDGSDQLFVTQWVDADSTTALAYWGELGEEVEAWTNLLPKRLRKLVVERISIVVRWRKGG